MTIFDSIINVDEWVSDHYLGSEENKESFLKRVKDRIKDWNKEDGSPWERLQSNRQALQKAHALIDAENPDSVRETARLQKVAFGYEPSQNVTLHTDADTLTFHGWSGNAGSAIWFAAEAIDGPEDLTDTHPLTTSVLNEKDTHLTTADLIGRIFLTDTPPNFVVVSAGPWMVLAERESWPLGRLLAVDLGTVVERGDKKSGGEMQHAAVIFARENVERAADGTTWWTDTLEDSRAHAVKVSESLRGAIKRSIEIIGNNVLDRHRRQGKPIDDIAGQELARQSLRYLYRILFLLFAEASPETEILPVGAPEYTEGYGLTRLRNLILSEPVSTRAQQGTHLYESIAELVRLVDEGHDPRKAEDFMEDAADDGLYFRNLKADLFLPEKTSYIDAVKLDNLALHKVLVNLLLSEEKKGQDRGFISYATLGVTELGQVYEGLMSYTGFIAQRDLYEVAPKGDDSKGSWVVPADEDLGLPDDSYVMEDKELSSGGTERTRKLHPTGSFVYRQSSRDRERSASFYSPQVITEFTVGQAIEVLEEEGRITKAKDILDLKICEPAMGSGAFAVEAVRQLAEKYLELRQSELDEYIAPDQRAAELQKVKAQIALHQIYGVDLNATAVELAEISLWLSTMTGELKAPWFGLHLRHGNSLIGARRSTYSTGDLKKKAWLKLEPQHHPLTGLAATLDSEGAELSDATTSGRIHHFLLPAAGWAAAADAKDLKSIFPDEQKQLKLWRKNVAVVPNKTQQKLLMELSQRVEVLWKFALQRLRIAEEQSKRDINYFGREDNSTTTVVSRKQIEEDLFNNENGAYRRLRLALDAWCALWFWPLTDVDNAPDFDEWLDTLAAILGRTGKGSKNANQVVMGSGMNWFELNDAEQTDIQFSAALTMDRVREAHPWITTVTEIADQQSFFHWDLDFGAVFAEGGFDLQIGNPPWVRPRTDVDALLSEHDPWFSLAHKPTQATKNERRAQLLDSSEAAAVTLSSGVSEQVTLSEVLGDPAQYPHLVNQQPDLYRGFMERTWQNSSDDGVICLVHPESHFTEQKAAPLRRGAYLRLRRHWQFINELKLFDVHDLVKYGIHAYGPAYETPLFKHAVSLYHPNTVTESLVHDGSGRPPGIKDDNDKWDLRPHKDRILTVNENALKMWHSVLESQETPVLESRMVYTVNTEAAAVLAKLARAPRISELGLQFSSGWHESADKKRGYFDTSWQHPDSWSNVILQGPHLGVSTPMIKQPNPTMKHNQDWSEVDLESMPERFLPATAYYPNSSMKTYESDYGIWDIAETVIPVASTFRLAWRAMANLTARRTFFPAVIPPKSKHIHGIACAGPISSENLAPLASSSAFLIDYFLRASGIAFITNRVVENFPSVQDSVLTSRLRKNFLWLNCLTSAYAPLWEEVTGTPWTVDTPIRKAWDRQQAQNEIDAIVALSLGVTADELCMIYRTQFPVMRKYDQQNLFDANGRLVPKEIVKAEGKAASGSKGTPESLSEAERTWTHPQSGVEYVFEYPFKPMDREAELRKAYAKYEAVLAESEK
ncbi:Eco57I restriction-modification methylase domain-containing protein [Corynebacterium phoceense]|uniref:Eco57I restriction-modification methylase domain-containing protein n=1 Tax=Corynebacterium phoceense TaxID=1686286 RepID=UPI00211C54FA|nr:DNA methyltransferase [Corynebacterium phoceense]MCQ9346081.1 class I SAM-dependent DNA methyltransferase [Corynebacterium phoceense]